MDFQSKNDILKKIDILEEKILSETKTTSKLFYKFCGDFYDDEEDLVILNDIRKCVKSEDTKHLSRVLKDCNTIWDELKPYNNTALNEVNIRRTLLKINSFVEQVVNTYRMSNLGVSTIKPQIKSTITKYLSGVIMVTNFVFTDDINLPSKDMIRVNIKFGTKVVALDINLT